MRTVVEQTDVQLLNDVVPELPLTISLDAAPHVAVSIDISNHKEGRLQAREYTPESVLRDGYGRWDIQANDSKLEFSLTNSTAHVVDRWNLRSL